MKKVLATLLIAAMAAIPLFAAAGCSDDSGRSIVLIKKISHTPPSFPRTAAKMAKKPIL